MKENTEAPSAESGVVAEQNVQILENKSIDAPPTFSKIQNWLMKAWHDPVGSKLISAGIIALSAIILTYFYSLISGNSYLEVLTKMYIWFSHTASVPYWMIAVTAFTGVILILAFLYVYQNRAIREPNSSLETSEIESFHERDIAVQDQSLTSDDSEKSDRFKASYELLMHDSDFFGIRLGQAFPGVRDLEWFEDPAKIVKRLKIFFDTPLIFKSSVHSEYTTDPIWWIRGLKNNAIDKFDVLDEDTVIIGNERLKVAKMAVFYDGREERSFIYLEADAEEPVGLYETDAKSIGESIERWGYANEEYAMFNDAPIPRSHYDDGATLIDGEPVSLDGGAKLQFRYTSSYNMLIIPKSSPINELAPERELEGLLNGMLKGERNFDELREAILRLPSKPKYGNYRRTIV